MLYLNGEKLSNAKVNSTCNITVHEKDLQQVQSLIYKEGLFTSDAKCEKEIRRRIGIEKFIFTSMNKVLISTIIELQ